MDDPPKLHIQLFGTFHLAYEQEPIVNLSTGKVQSLLVYLVLHPEVPQSRQTLSYLFWPESSESQARTNLRQTLHQLKQRFPNAEEFIRIEAKTLQWNEQAAMSLDVAEFQAQLKTASIAEQRNNPSTQIQCLQQAVDVYRGVLCPGCYEDWIVQERDRFHQEIIGALEKLISLLDARQDYDAAIRYGQKLLAIDPLHESAYRSLMKAYAAKGDRSSAVQTYEQCCAVLRDELGVEPSPSTRDAYHHLLKTEAIPNSSLHHEDRITSSTSPPLVGRTREWQQLQADWQRSMAGQARFVLIKGEAGIGKSRLAEELLVMCHRNRTPALQTRCYAAEGRLSYAPITDWLRSTEIKSCLGNLDPVWLSELTRLLPELLTEYQTLSRAQPLTESWQRQNFYEAIVQAFQLWLTTGCDGGFQPALFVVDDLQWCDLETLEWLQYFLRVVRQHPILIVGTARSEELDSTCPLETLLRSLHRDEQVTEISLDRLDSKATATLASSIAAQELGVDQATALFHQTEGHPLFIVEMMRANLIERFRETDSSVDQEPLRIKAEPDSVTVLPPKVQSILSARLAQLSPSARQLVGLAATVGRSFTIDILHHANGDDEEDVVNALDELWKCRIIRDHGLDAYDFSHDKLRDVAYESINGPKRRLLHRRVAEALETIFAHDLDAVSAQVAAHYEKAGLSSKAVPYYLQAAEVAQRIYANTEAIHAFRQALKLLQAMPITQKRLEQELSINTRLGVSLVAVQGYGSSEVKTVYEQARSLAQQLGYPTTPPVIRALAITAIVQGDLKLALDLGHQMIALTKDDQNTILNVEAHYVMGVTTFWLGNFNDSQHYLRCAIERYQPNYQHDHLALYAQDPYIICHSRLAFTLWCLGCVDESITASQVAVTAAHELAHPFTLAYALTWTTLLHSRRRDIKQTAQYAAEVITLSEEKELGIWLAMGRLLQG